MHPPKLVLSVIWILCLAAFVVATGSTAAALGRGLFWLLLVAHVVECAVYWKRLRAAPGPIAHHVVQTLLFGVLHVSRLPTALPESC